MADTAIYLNVKLAESLSMAAFVNLQDGCIFKYVGKFKYGGIFKMNNMAVTREV
jgi:hypothetical protein